MCFGLGSGGIAVPLGAKGLVLASYIRILLIGLFLYSLIELISLDIVRGVIDMLLIIIASMAIKGPSNTAIDQSRVMCLMIFSAVRLIISIIFSAMFFSSTIASNWQSILMVIVYTVGPPLWATSVALNGSLYFELKRILNEMVASMDGGESGMGGGGLAGMGGMFSQPQQRAQAAPDASASSGTYQAPLLRNPAAASDSTPAGFRAFAGQGHRLS